MRLPLLLAIGFSSLMHASLVLAFLRVPDQRPFPEPEPRTEIWLGPQFYSQAEAQSTPSPLSPAPLPPASEILHAQDLSETANEPVTRPEFVPISTSPIPDLQSLPPALAPEAPVSEEVRTSRLTLALDPVPAAEVAKPIPTEAAVAAPAAEAGTIQTPPEAKRENNAGADKPSSNIAKGPEIASLVPSELAASGVSLAAPLFPPEASSLGTLPTPKGETLALPVISSDEVSASANEVKPETVDPSDLQSVADSGPDGASGRLVGQNPQDAARARALPPKRRPTSPSSGEANTGNTNSSGVSRATRSGGEIHNPSVRAGYSGNLSSHLRKKLVFPNEGPSGTVLVRFILDRSGRILQASVVGSSGAAALDQAALEMVRRAAPFPRFPEGFGSSQLEVTLPVNFKGR